LLHLIGMLILASHAGVTATPAAAMVQQAATRWSLVAVQPISDLVRLLPFLHFDVLFSSRKGGNPSFLSFFLYQQLCILAVSSDSFKVIEMFEDDG
jgi:hypothetical protein